jgi:RNA-directed DNA polymerase
MSNLFLHYVFDVWINKKYPNTPWCRYADDGLVHCKTEMQAKQILAGMHKRFNECKLELHPDKTKIVYCKDGDRKNEYSETQFDFLGYTFRCRKAKNTKKDSIFANFSPAVSKRATKLMRMKIRKSNIRNRSDLELKDIARWFNPILRGWIGYYGKYYRSALYSVFRHFNRTLVTWIMHKYKKFKGHKTRAMCVLERILRKEPCLFEHWKIGMVGAFA